MRTPLVVSLILAGGVGLVTVSQLVAQRTTAPPPSRTKTVLVDMSAIAQNSTRLKQSMDALRADYVAKGEALKKEGEAGNRITEEARKLPAGSPERKEMEQKVLSLRADFELHGKKVNDETRERETKIVYSMLQELKEEMARHAQANGEQLILRHDPTPPDLSDPRAILAEIQKPIVYQRGTDVTPAILEALNRRAPAAAATSRAPASGNPATKGVRR
jgi:Skp family chaperone for outer membrane proteins